MGLLPAHMTLEFTHCAATHLVADVPIVNTLRQPIRCTLALAAGAAYNLNNMTFQRWKSKAEVSNLVGDEATDRVAAAAARKAAARRQAAAEADAAMAALMVCAP